MANFHALVNLAPDDSLSHKAMAEGYELSGEYDKAEGELAGVVMRDTKDLAALLRLGSLYAALAKKATTSSARDGYVQKAQATFQKVLDAQPENVAASRAIQELKAAPSPQ